MSIKTQLFINFYGREQDKNLNVLTIFRIV